MERVFRSSVMYLLCEWRIKSLQDRNIEKQYICCITPLHCWKHWLFSSSSTTLSDLFPQFAHSDSYSCRWLPARAKNHMEFQLIRAQGQLAVMPQIWCTTSPASSSWKKLLLKAIWITTAGLYSKRAEQSTQEISQCITLMSQRTRLMHLPELAH